MGRKVVLSKYGPPAQETDTKRRKSYAESEDLRVAGDSQGCAGNRPRAIAAVTASRRLFTASF